MNTPEKSRSTGLQAQDNQLKLVVLISGSGSNLQAIIDHSRKGALNAQVVAVISDQPGAYGLTRAENASIPAFACPASDFECRREHEQALEAMIMDHEPDLLILAGFMRILSPRFVDHFPIRILNIHPSLLPKLKGLHTHQRAIDSGEKHHGATVHIVTPDLDSGPIIAQTAIAISRADNAETLGEKVLIEEHALYSASIQYFTENPDLLPKHVPFRQPGSISLDRFQPPEDI